MSMPPYIVHQDDVAEEESRYPRPFDAELLSFSRELGKAAGSRALGFNLERIPPGRRTSFTHAHSDEEELVYVLSGDGCVVRVIDPGAAEPREIPLRPGHVVAFPAGTGIAHTFANRGTTDCLLLAVGERKPDTDRVRYPEDQEYDRHIASARPARYWGSEG